MVSTVPETLRGFLLPYAAHFRRRAFRVDAMARGVSRCHECVGGFDRVWEVGWSRNPLDPRNLGPARRRVLEAVSRGSYAIVHVHTPVAAFVSRLALRRRGLTAGPRVVYTAHGFHFYRGGPPLRGAVFRALETLAARWTDYLVVMNREDEEAARRLLPPERVWHMPGIGVDRRRYAAEAVTEAEVEGVRRELGLRVGERIFLMIAEFIPRKRHRDALSAFARLGRVDARLAFAGTGPLEEAMKRQVAELGLSGRVHFLGVRRDVPTLIRASVAVLLPSEQEGLPRSAMESLSLGVPVVGSRIRGTADLLGSGGGLLVSLGDVAALAGALRRVLDYPEQAREMGRRGREHMADYDLERVIGLHERLYEEALRGRPAVRA
jgi:glycosyltransferase involved in cell wall biosynthesis